MAPKVQSTLLGCMATKRKRFNEAELEHQDLTTNQG